MTVLPAAFLRVPIAHRGFHAQNRGAIENSPTAVRAAIAAGYGIEIDVQATRDGRAAVFHDDNLDRLTDETGPVHHRTAAELGQIALVGGNDRIPMLEEVLALVAGRVALLIEIKQRPGAGLERAVARALRGYSGPVAVMSFDPLPIAEMARLATAIPRGLATCSFRPDDWPDVPGATLFRLRGIPDYDAVGASFISHEAEDLSRPRVAELKARGATILCWTIRSPAAEAAARRIADNVTFEGYPARLSP